MKVGITGGSGFIGTWIRKELLRKGHSVVVFDRYPHYTDLQNNEEFMLGDVRDETSVFELAAHVDGIIHLAAVLGTQETVDFPRPSVETNVFGSLNVFTAATRYELPVAYAGVGNAAMRTTGAGAYTISKTCAEDFARMFNLYRGGNIAIVRPTNAYGPGQSVSQPFGSSAVRKIMPSFICRALTGMPVELYGGGTQISDCVFVEDVARVFVQTLEYTKHGMRPEFPVEVGPEYSMTVREIAETVLRVTESRSELVDLPMRRGETPNAVVKSDCKTLQQVGISAKAFTSLETGVLETSLYYKGYLIGRGPF